MWWPALGVRGYAASWAYPPLDIPTPPQVTPTPPPGRHWYQRYPYHEKNMGPGIPSHLWTEWLPVGCIFPACSPYVYWPALGVGGGGVRSLLGVSTPGHTHSSQVIPTPPPGRHWYQRYPLKRTWDQGYHPPFGQNG